MVFPLPGGPQKMMEEAGLAPAESAAAFRRQAGVPVRQTRRVDGGAHVQPAAHETMVWIRVVWCRRVPFAGSENDRRRSGAWVVTLFRFTL